MGDDAAGSKSIIVMLRYCPGSRFCSIAQLDTQLDLEPPLPPPRSEYDIKSADANYLAHFNLKTIPPESAALFTWLFAAPPSSTNDLYVVPNSPCLSIEHVELHGATFNCSTKMMKPMKRHIAFSRGRIPVTVGEDIFFLADPILAYYQDKTEPGFDRYIPAENKWEKEARFPYRGVQGLGHHGRIKAYAVWNDIILLNLGGKQIWAYHVIKRKWYRVLVGDEKEDGINYDDVEEVVKEEVEESEEDSPKEEEEEEEDSESEEDSPKEEEEEEDSESEEDSPKEEEEEDKVGKKDNFVDNHDDDVDVDEEDKSNDLCYAIIGQGFVVNNTIYALCKVSFSSVLALSIEQTEVAGGDLQFRCKFQSEFSVPYMTEIEGYDGFSDRRFLHLGGDNFCLVQSLRFYDSLSVSYQPIQVTYLKLIEDKMVVTNILEHRLTSDRFHGQFRIGLCFFKPEFKVTALKKGETTFDFYPDSGSAVERESCHDSVTGSALEREEKTDCNLPKDSPQLAQLNVIGEEEAQLDVIDEGGHFVVVNLPLDPDLAGIVPAQLLLELAKFGPITYFREFKTKRGIFAHLGFSSEDAKAQAIQASPIEIRGYPVHVLETRRTSNAEGASVCSKIKMDGGMRKGLHQLLE